MSVAEQPQRMQALALANEIRLTATRERDELRGAPVGVVFAAVVDPTPAIGSMRLGLLFTPTRKYGAGGCIERFGRTGLTAAFNELSRDKRLFRCNWHERLRLRELSRHERQALMRAIVKRSPKGWRYAA